MNYTSKGRRLGGRMMDLRKSAIARTEGFESICSYFYLDTLGNVTIGYGRLVADADAAAVLPLVKADGSTASDNEKRAEWNNINGQEAGHLASYYEQFVSLFLSDSDAESLLTSDLTTSVGYLGGKFSKLDSFPEDAQDALLDMIFNIGTGKFTSSKWPSLFAAVNAKDWVTAAAQSNRPAVGASRNDAIKQLFLNAATKTYSSQFATALQGYDVGSLNAVFREHLADVLKLATSPETVARVFPNGINQIEVTAKAGPVELSLKLDGHNTPKGEP